MPLSLKSKLSKLRHNGQITYAEHQELIKKLDGHDRDIVEQVIRNVIASLSDIQCGFGTLEEYIGQLEESVKKGG